MKSFREKRTQRRIQLAPVSSTGQAVHGLEVERYELRNAPFYRFKLARRRFFKLLGGGIFVVSLVRHAAAQESGGAGRRRGGGSQRPQEIGAWLHIDEKGAVTVFTGKVEVGQNARTSLTQIVAEELRVPVSAVRLIMADTQQTPFDPGTFGSQTTPQMGTQLRRVSAAARQVLLELAAELEKADATALKSADGKITNPATSRSYSYGELTKGQKLMKTVGENPPVTPAAEWKIAGTPVPKVDADQFVNGKHQFTSDLHLPGMLHGKVLRGPANRSRLVSADAKDAQNLPGVTVVQDGNFVGVAAADVQSAQRALGMVKAEWQNDRQVSDSELYAHLKKTARNPRPAGAPSTSENGADGEIRLQASYTIAYIAHAPLEPRAAVAEWKDDRLTVWTGTQRPFGVRSELAQAFKIPEERIRVIVPDTGSGYGGKHTGEAAVEAARLAKSAGKPVKLVWTREEEFQWAYLRPAGVIEVSSSVTREGRIGSWDFHNYNSGGSGIRTLYDIPGAKTEFHDAQSPLRQGSYRGLAATANHFAREMHMDELARAVKMDPLEFRLKNLKDARLRKVLETAADRFGWNDAKSDDQRGVGIAGGFEKGSYLATCAEVVIDRKTGRISVKRVVQAFDCGAVINPDQLRNQNEGAIVMGIGGALFEAIHFDGDRILNPRFSEYRVPRFSDAPKIEVVLVDRKDTASAGAGETPIVGIAPAIGNAVFAATRVRLRSLPMGTVPVQGA